MRTIMTIAILSALAPSAAWAQEACGQLQILNTVQMTRLPDGRDIIPVSLNGTPKNFLFDTGGSLTMLNDEVAEEMKLPNHLSRYQMYSLTGSISNKAARIENYVVDHMRGADVEIQLMPLPSRAFDGIMGLDGWIVLDLDVDFGTDKLNMFSPSHCPGRIQYWSAPAMAVMPLAMDGLHITVPVMVDGKQEQALIDSGATNSTLTIKEARRAFDLTMGNDEALEAGLLNGDASLKTYKNRFQTLAFGDITVKKPELELIPDAVGRNLSTRQLVGNRTKTDRDLVAAPDVIIGMDVLRKLHLYMSFKENKLYITDASVPAPAATTPAQ